MTHPRRHLQGLRHPRAVPAGARRGRRRAHRLRPGAAAGRVPARRGHGPPALVGRPARGVRRRRGRRRRVDRGFRPRAHGDALLRRRLAGAGRRGHGDRVAQPAAVQRHEARAGGRAAAERRLRHPGAQGAGAGARPNCRRCLAPACSSASTSIRLTSSTCSSWWMSVRSVPYRVVMDAANGVAGKLARGCLTAARARSRRDVLRGRRHVPQPRAEPVARGEQPRDPRAGRRREGRPRHRLGRRRRPLLLHRRGRRVRARRLRHCAARRGPADQEPRREDPLRPARQPRRARRDRGNGGVPLLNRVGHAFFKQRMRREGGLFGGEVSGHYYFADNYNADSGFIPALLILDLMSQKRATMARAAGAAAHEVLHQRRDQLGGRRRAGGTGPHRGAVRRRRARPPRRHLRGLHRLALQRAVVQHRAAAAPQSRAPTRRRSWRRSATSCSPSSSRAEMAAAVDLGPARVAEIDTLRHVRGSRRAARQLRERVRDRSRRLAGAFFGTFPAIPPAEPSGSSCAAWAGRPSAPT